MKLIEPTSAPGFESSFVLEIFSCFDLSELSTRRSFNQCWRHSKWMGHKRVSKAIFNLFPAVLFHQHLFFLHSPPAQTFRCKAERWKNIPKCIFVCRTFFFVLMLLFVSSFIERFIMESMCVESWIEISTFRSTKMGEKINVYLNLNI